MRYFLSGSFIAFFLFTGNAVPAQPPLGIRIGMGLSMPAATLASSAQESWSPGSKNGIVLCLFTQVPLQGKWLLQPGAQYVSKGLREKHTSSSYSYSIPNHFSYLEIPLNLIHASQPNGNGFLIGAGPAVGFLLNRSYRAYSLKSVDYGVNALLGFQTPIGFSVKLNYTYGLGNVSDNAAYVPEIKNRFAAFTFGYLF